MLALKARIGSENAIISAAIGDSFVRYTLREDHQPGQFDLWHWDFDLESHFVVRRHIEGAAEDNIKVTYQLETHLLESFADSKRPYLLDRSETIVQNFSNRRGGRLGTKSTITELGWIPVGKAVKIVDADSFAFRSPGEILKYIDEGKKLVVDNTSTSGQ